MMLVKWAQEALECLRLYCEFAIIIQMVFAYNSSPTAADVLQYLAIPHRITDNCKKGGKFLCSAVSDRQDDSKRFSLYFPGRPVQSNTVSTPLGSIQPHATISAQSSYTYPSAE